MLTRAAAAERQGDLAAALAGYRNILDRFPANRRARAALSKVARKLDGAMAGHCAALRRHVANGATAQAAVMADSLLAAAPRTPALLSAAAEVQTALSHHETAAELYREALVFDPDHAETRLNLGVSLFRQGDVTAAVETFRALAADHPHFGAAHLNLALALDAAGALDDAISSCRTAQRYLPDPADALLPLAGLLRRADRRAEAAAAYADLLDRRPGSVPALNNFAALELERNRPEAALSHYESLRLVRPDDPQAPIGRARALAASGRREEAEAAFRAAADARPSDPWPLLELGHMHREYGRAAEAAGAYEAALDRAPDLGPAWAALALVHDFAPSDPFIGRAEAALDRAATEEDRAGLHFALAQARHRTGDHDAAFAHFAAGNALRRALLGYDPARDLADFAAMETAFAAPPPPLGVDPAAPRPVFVLGMPRSGTSLVEQILAAHPQVHAAGELSAFDRAARRLALPAIREGQSPDARALNAIRAAYLARLEELGTDRPVVTDKLPANAFWIGTILSALPEARILLLRRDPVAVCWSCFTTDFRGGGNGFACDLGDLAARHRAHDRLMAHWHRLYPGRIHDVDYEALTAAPEAVARAFVAHAGLDWDPACLDFARLDRRVATASALQVRQGVYTGSSDAWRRYERHLGPLIAALGG
ncbi:MAG: sulfotransferase [Pseudooceanicola sp.]